MTPSTSSWPDRPRGIFINTESDKQTEELREKLQSGIDAQWFDQVRPPENPGPMTDLRSDYDHEAERKAAPSEPTEEYRKEALEYVTSILDVKERLRPNSLRELSELPTGVTRQTSLSWVYYRTTTKIEARTDDIPVSKADIKEHGKYLFFTPGEPQHLETIVIEQLQKRPFETAKVPTIPNWQQEAVLCLYYEDDRYRATLRETYQNEPDDDETHDVASPFDPNQPVIKPRGFKTDAATRRGEYSDEYRNSL